MDEFELINTWFNRSGLHPHSAHIVLGNGDDCTVIKVPSGFALAQSIDTQVADVHFPASAPPELVAWRALSASVSDLAAMGARPHSFSFALTLPEPSQKWLSGLSQGLTDFAQQFNMVLLGGDTTKGPLALTFHVQGFVTADAALKRSAVRPGDHIYVSGTLGDAGAALPMVLDGMLPDSVSNAAQQALLNSYYYPQPQVELGQWLVANGVRAAIDVSDGLLADLNHMLTASDAGACLNTEDLPLSEALLSVYSKKEATRLALTAGDDYQLCFCCPSENIVLQPSPVPVTRIGVVTEHKGIVDQAGNHYSGKGFKHFE